MPPKSPPWTREEIILALDLYLRLGRRIPGPDDQAVLQLSKYLNQLPIHDPSVRAFNFRNPAGVVLKIANLRAFDKTTSSVGMRRGSRLDQEIYEEFEDHPERVAHEALEILRRFGPPNDQSEPLEFRRAAERTPQYGMNVELDENLD
jgi:5-methylcytosine-specific restriction protein A